MSEPAREVDEVADGLAMLLAFHGTMRRLMKRMHELGERPPAAVSAHTVQAILDVLNGPLIWHDVDEETLLMPELEARLRERHLDVDPGLKRCRRDHAQLEELVEAIVPHLEEVSAGAESNPVLLKTAALELEALLLPHFELEESIVFPIARRLFSVEDRIKLGATLEMRRVARDASPSSGIDDQLGGEA